MKIALEQNTESIFGNKNYAVKLDNSPIFLIQKSIIPFTSKYIIREAKDKIKIGEFVGNPHDLDYGAILRLRRQEIHLDKIKKGNFIAEWQNIPNKTQILKCINQTWFVYENEIIIAEWEFNKIIKFGRNHIELIVTSNSDILPLITYVAILDIYRMTYSIGFNDAN